MLRQGFLGLLLIASLASAPLGAADVLSVGFVDIAYLIDNSPQSVQARERLEREFLPRQQEMNELREERSRSESALTQVDADDAAQRELNERELRAIERRLQRQEQAFREDLNIKRNSELKSVRDMVLESVAVFARKEGFDLILTDGVLFSSARVDVTQRVLEQLRKQP